MEQQSHTIVRLSLRWVFIALLIVIGVGILGGLIGSSFGTSRQPLSRQQDQLVTTVQEVTVSPSSAAQEIVRSHERSVVVLAHGSTTNPIMLGTGLVITNDGLIVSFHLPLS